MLRSFDMPEPLHLRSDGDDNVVEGWIVPYGQVAQVYDLTPDGPVTYREGFLPGSCTRMAQGVKRRGNAGFIRLTLEHGNQLTDRLGCGISLEERGNDGAYATFKLYRSASLELVRSMIEDSHDGFSIEFDDVVPPVERDGVTWRRQVQIPAVTLTPQPAYVGARVAALRDGSAELIDAPNLTAAQALLDEMRQGVPTMSPTNQDAT